MLRPIQKVSCWPGLAAAFDLQVRLALWLCESATTPAQINEAGIRTLHSNTVVQDWLWTFLCLKKNAKAFIAYAGIVASQPASEKQRLRDWLEVVKEVATQFQPAPPAWPTPATELTCWASFKELMLAFYERFRSSGLPFDANGKPTVGTGVTYAAFVKEFKYIHGGQVCVICGSHLGAAQVDHWITKAYFPLLSIAPDNMLPICYECNQPPQKGQKHVCQLGVPVSFAEWFHPFHRPGYGLLDAKYDEKLKVLAHPKDLAAAKHVANIDELFRLSERWTTKFKERYRYWQKSLQQLISKGRLHATATAIAEEAQRQLDGLVPDSENFHIYREVYLCAQEPMRLKALVAELSP